MTLSKANRDLQLGNQKITTWITWGLSLHRMYPTGFDHCPHESATRGLEHHRFSKDHSLLWNFGIGFCFLASSTQWCTSFFNKQVDWLAWVAPRKLTWRWIIHHLKCISCWIWGFSNVMLVFRGVIEIRGARGVQTWTRQLIFRHIPSLYPTRNRKSMNTNDHLGFFRLCSNDSIFYNFVIS